MAISFRKPLLIVSAVIIGLLALFLAFAHMANYSDGYRAGTIVKMSHKGWLFKTYEGQLQTGSVQSGAATVWEFSVAPSNKEVLAQIETAVDKGHRVKLYYAEKIVRLPWRGDTRHFVYKVEELAN